MHDPIIHIAYSEECFLTARTPVMQKRYLTLRTNRIQEFEPFVPRRTPPDYQRLNTAPLRFTDPARAKTPPSRPAGKGPAETPVGRGENGENDGKKAKTARGTLGTFPSLRLTAYAADGKGQCCFHAVAFLCKVANANKSGD